MDILVWIFGVPGIILLWLTAVLVKREHSDRRLSARRGYSWGSSYNDRQAAARAAAHETEVVRRAGWPL